MQNILNTSVEKIAELIYPAGFYKRKAEYILRTTKILVEQYKSDIPANIKELTKLPGVGPKMAYLCMTHAWNNVVGIGVDVHVHRISNRLGWVQTKEPEHTRNALESFVPEKYWKEINTLLVGFGQTICKPVGPKCSSCTLQSTCEYFLQNDGMTKAPKKKKKETADKQVLADIESLAPEEQQQEPRRSPRIKKKLNL